MEDSIIHEQPLVDTSIETDTETDSNVKETDFFQLKVAIFYMIIKKKTIKFIRKRRIYERCMIQSIMSNRLSIRPSKQTLKLKAMLKKLILFS